MSAFKNRFHKRVSLNKIFHVQNCTTWFLILLSVLMFIYLTVFASKQLILETIEDSNQLICSRITATLSQSESLAQYFAWSEILQSYLTCEDEYERIEHWKQLGDLTEPLIGTNQDLFAIIIYRSSHRTPFFSNYPFPDNAPFYSIAPRFEEESSAFQGFDVIYGRYETHPSYAIYSQPIISTYNYDSLGAFLGSVVVVLNPDFLDTILRLVSPEEIIASISITDEYGNIIAKTEAPRNRVNHFVSSFTTSIDGTDWSITCYSDNLWIIRQYLIPIFLFSLFLFLIIFMLFKTNRNIQNYLNKPIAELCANLITLTYEQESLLPLGNTQEINKIIESFNMLLTERQNAAAKMHQLEMEHYEARLSKKVSDLQYLVSQINPHFLLNTLSCIGGIATLYQANEIMDIVSNFSETIRYALYQSDIVTLRDECTIIRKYFNIIRIRFQNVYTLSLSVPDELLNCPMPKMILQPIIENALYHGLEPKSSGHIQLSVEAKGDLLYITVSDDGVGMSEEQVVSFQNTLDNSAKLEYSSILEKKIGNVNVCRRIKLIYGEEYGMKIASKPEIGTTVTVYFPLSLPAKQEPYCFLHAK